MLTIRLKRMGRRNRPFFRIVLIESARSTQGKYIEDLGHFDPRDKKKTLTLTGERLTHWLSQGAQMSATVHNMLVSAGVVSKPKRKVK